MNLYCRTCQQFASTEGLKQITEWRGTKGVALFIGQGISHEFLSPEASAKKMPPPPPEPTQITQAPVEPPPTPPPAEPIIQQVPVVASGTTAETEAIPHVRDMGDSSEWVPSPDEWYIVTVATRHRPYITAHLSNGDEVFIHEADFSIASLPNAHQCLVAQVGDVLNVRVKPNDRLSGSKWRSIEAVVTKEYLLDDSDRGTVLWWNDEKNVGMVERDCGCYAFCADQSAINIQKDDDVIVSNWKQTTTPGREGVVATNIRKVRKLQPVEYNDDIVRI